MSIQVISDSVNKVIFKTTSGFTTHKLIEIIIADSNKDWNNYVMKYRKEGRSIREQEQIAVRNIGAYLSRKIEALNIKNNGKINSTDIKGLKEHKPRITTTWQKL